MPTPTICIFDRQGVVVNVSGLSLEVDQFSWAAEGGPDGARLIVTGDERSLAGLAGWLRYAVEIYNCAGQRVWWGFVHGVQIDGAAGRLGIDLDGMANAVAVEYTYPLALGNDLPFGELRNFRARTDWALDEQSIGEYGRKELRVDGGGLDATSAGQLRDSILGQRRYPVAALDPALRQAQGAVLECLGWWHMLGWQYAEVPEGQEAYTGGDGFRQKIGWGFSGALGFEDSTREIHDIAGRFLDLAPGEQIVISGSAHNNRVFTITRGTDRPAWTYTSNTLGFAAGSGAGKWRITDSACQLLGWRARDYVQVAGAANAANNQYLRVQGWAQDGSWIECWQPMVDEPAGAMVTLKRGHAVGVAEAVVHDMPGPAPSVVRVVGWQTAQGVRLSGEMNWDAARVYVFLARRGAPQDGVRVGLWSDGANVPGSELAGVTIAPSWISPEGAWVEAILPTGVSLDDDWTRWLVVSHSGGADHEDYYEVQLSRSAGYQGGQGYGGGAALLCNSAAGGTWQAAAPPADMRFTILGKQETTAQLQTLLMRCSAISGVDLKTVSGVYACQHRDGRRRLDAEIGALLQAGAAGGERLLAGVDEYRRAWVDRAPVEGAGTWCMRQDGTLLDPHGAPVAWGMTPAGQWLALDGEVAQWQSQVNYIGAPSPVFVERCTVDGKTGLISVG